MRRFAIALFVCVSLFAQPEPAPTPSKGDRRQEQNKTEGNKERPAFENPTATSAARNPATQSANGNQEADANREIADYTNSLARYTRALVIVGVLQCFALALQAIFIYRGFVEARKAADAARDSADAAKQAFVATHRPRLTVRFVCAEGIQDLRASSGRLLVFNSGSTDAILKRSYSEILAGDQLPAMAPYEGTAGASLNDETIVPGGYVELRFPIFAPANFEEHKAQRGGKVLLIGWLYYADRSGRMRKVGFCRKYDPSTKRFEIQKDADYEYDDERQPYHATFTAKPRARARDPQSRAPECRPSLCPAVTGRSTRPPIAASY